MHFIDINNDVSFLSNYSGHWHVFIKDKKKIIIIIFLKTILRNLSSFLYKYFRPSLKTRHIFSPSPSCLIVQLFVTERQKENKTEQQDRLNEHNITYYIYKKNFLFVTRMSGWNVHKNKFVETIKKIIFQRITAL